MLTKKLNIGKFEGGHFLDLLILSENYRLWLLRVKWANTFSSEFSASNGVKQGGVISPLLFCVYMDGLISELLASNVGCYMGAVYAGIF